MFSATSNRIFAWFQNQCGLIDLAHIATKLSKIWFGWFGFWKNISADWILLINKWSLKQLECFHVDTAWFLWFCFFLLCGCSYLENMTKPFSQRKRVLDVGSQLLSAHYAQRQTLRAKRWYTCVSEVAEEAELMQLSPCIQYRQYYWGANICGACEN